MSKQNILYACSFFTRYVVEKKRSSKLHCISNTVVCCILYSSASSPFHSLFFWCYYTTHTNTHWLVYIKCDAVCCQLNREGGCKKRSKMPCNPKYTISCNVSMSFHLLYHCIRYRYWCIFFLRAKQRTSFTLHKTLVGLVGVLYWIFFWARRSVAEVNESKEVSSL